MSGRPTTVFLEDPLAAPASAVDRLSTACGAVLEAFEGQPLQATVDPSSASPRLPDDAASACEALRARAAGREGGRRKRRLLGWGGGAGRRTVDLDPTDPSDRELLCRFAPYSLRAEVFLAGRESPILSLHESGALVQLGVDVEELAGVARALQRAGLGDMTLVQ